jgi:signal transduction histidine kinase
MKPDSSTKLFSWYYFVTITLVLVVGVVSTALTFAKISENTQKALLKNTTSIASLLEPGSILALRGDEGDLESPEYISLKNKLAKIVELNTEIRFVYLWGYRDDNPFFFVDSEPATSEDYSPPGQIYDEATELDRDLLLNKVSSGIEISSDRWGTWLTALTQIKNPATGEVVAVMGMDMDAHNYFRAIYVYTAIPIITTIFVLILILVDFILRKREKEFLTFKSELVSIASHEIRSPLTGISWLADGLLQNPDTMSIKQKENIGIIKTKSEGLLGTINDLLDEAATEKVNKKKLDKKPILMIPLLQGILNDSFLVLAEKNVKLKIDESVTPPLALYGDPDKIKRMFNNLISNAIKYSKNGGEVKVGAIITNKSIVSWVKDDGIGIPEKDQAKIFRGFFRAENAKKVTNNGTGLGLHYVRQIAELHNGKVWCESKEGTGTTFFVELPKV